MTPNTGRNASLHLINSAEYMSVVLLEAPDPRQTRQRSRELVTVQHAEVGQSERKFTPGARPMTEHQTDGGRKREIMID